MEIKNFRWVEGDDRLELAVHIDGEETIIPAEQKATLINNGYFFLGPKFENILPELVFKKLTLRGFVQDSQLTQQYLEFMQTS